jgi:hypothetical protein
MTNCRLLDDRTHDLISWARDAQAAATDDFAAARQLVIRLGVHVQDDYAAVGFWTPELAAHTSAIRRYPA